MTHKITTYLKNKFIESSAILAIVYTLGHIIIAMYCNYFITGAPLELAALDALIEPCINGVWFYVLHRIYKYYTSQLKTS